MKKFLIFLSIATLFLSACQKESIDQATVKLPEKADEQVEPIESIQTEVVPTFINLDELERYGSITASGWDYTDIELKEFEKDESRKDYVEVAKKFVKEHLQSEATFLSTADGTYNPRKVVVGTAKGDIYSFELNRWHNYSGIWTVGYFSKYYSEHGSEGTVPPENTIKYEIVELDDVNQEVQDWANELLAKKQEGHAYLPLEGMVYVFITAEEGESVELLDIKGDDYIMSVRYANSFINIYEKYGEKPYVLIKVTSPISEIVFSGYKSLVKDHPSLYRP